MVERLPVEVALLDADIGAAAAELRAPHRSLKLPDALVIATAANLGASHLITTDRGSPSKTRLRVRTSITTI